MANKALAVLLGVVAVLGLKSYNKASAHDAVKQRLVAACEGESVCEGAVATHFEACFDSAYKYGGRRQASRLETGQLVECLNTHANRVYFVYDEK
jgi:hypothetical protein